MARRPDTRSAAAAEYRSLYKTAAWSRRRLAQLAAEPLCRMCARFGVVTPATVADHITPHRGDLDLFHGPLQSLCAPCHDGPKQADDLRGYSIDIGPDGWPVDPKRK